MWLDAYHRGEAVAYAEKWAFGRNPSYFDFEKIGGDCTNFVSQCIFAGSETMNDTKIFGWYYYSAKNRTASWTGVEYLYRFLTSNNGVGPFGTLVPHDKIEVGDVVQLGTSVGDFYHSPIVVALDADEIYVAAHSQDAFMRPLSSYVYDQARFIHIIGVRKE